MADTTISQGPEANNVNVTGDVNINDFGGVDTYTILAGLSDDVTITDNSGATINLPTGLSVSNVSFLSNGLQFVVNGHTVTFLGAPENFNYVFGGTPLDPTAGTTLTFDETAAAFGTTVPADGEPANTGNDGTIQDDGSVAVAGDITVTASPSTINETDTTTTTITVDASGTSATEGDAVTIDLSGTNIENADIASVSSGTLSGLQITGLTLDASLQATVDITAATDGTTEGDETMTVQATVGSDTGSTNVTITDTSSEVTFQLTSDATAVNQEGDTITFTVTPEGTVANDTTLFVLIEGTAVGAITDPAEGADFDNVALEVTFTAGTTAALSVPSNVLEGDGTEGPEGFKAFLTDSSFNPVDGADTITGVINESDTVGVSLALTTAADSFAPGAADPADRTTTGNDTITGALATFQSGDDLDGGDGDDLLQVDLGATIAPEVDNIENFIVDARGGVADLSFGDISGVTSLKLEGTNDAIFRDFPSAVPIEVTDGYDETLGVVFGDVSGTADALDVIVSNGSAFDLVLGTGVGTALSSATFAGTSQDLEILNINVTGMAFSAGLIDLGLTSAINISGDQDITLGFGSDVFTAKGAAATAGNATALASISATALSGDLTLNLGISGNHSVSGGTGNDTVDFRTALSINDSFDGGEGNDTLGATISVVSTIRPTLMSVEKADLDFNAAGTFDGTNTDASLAEIDVKYSAAATLEDLPSGVGIINLESAGADDGLQIEFRADPGDVVINVGTTGTATAGFLANSATINDASVVTINSTGLGTSNSFSAVQINDATAVTINVVSESAALALASLQMPAADDVTINVLGNRFSAQEFSAGGTGTLAFNISGTGGVFIGSASAPEITTLSITNTGGTGGIAVGTDFSAANLLDVNIDTVGGFVTMTALRPASAETAAYTLDIDINTDSAVVSIDDLVLNAQTGGEVEIDITGGGDVTLGALNGSLDPTALNTPIEIDAANLSGSLTLNFSAASAAQFDVILGNAGTDTSNDVSLGVGADTIVGGTGIDIIEAGGGNDEITGGAGNDIFVFLTPSAATGAGASAAVLEDHTAGGQDTITDFDAGDIILFNGLLSVTAGAGVGNVTAVQTQSFTATFPGTAGDIAIFESGDDVILQVALGSADDVNGVSSGIVQILLQGQSFSAGTETALIASITQLPSGLTFVGA